MRLTVLLVSLCVLLCSTVSLADELYLKNGDKLTGQILRMTEDKLVFKSSSLGEVTVSLSQVRTFSTEAPLEVHLKDGTVLHQPVVAAEPNQFSIAAGEPLKPQTFAFTQLGSINPPPKPPVKWTGSISGSVGLTSGNTSTETLSGSLGMVRRSEKDRITVNADYAKSDRRNPVTKEDETTENWWKTKAQYDYFFTKKFFGFVNGRLEKDAIAELDRRVVVGGGGGYQWIEEPETSFSTSFGLASLYEKFENETDSNSELSLQAGYNLNKTLYKKVTLLHDLTYYPSVEKFSDYFLTTTAEVRATMVKNLFASFRVIFDYDSTPAIGRGNTDVKYILGIGLNF